MKTRGPTPYDLLLVGGGLASGLIALAVRHLAPATRVAIVERGDRLAGNHIWSFHETDLGPNPDTRARIHAWVAPARPHRISRYELRFPDHVCRFDQPFYTIAADRFAAAVNEATTDNDGRVVTGVAATRVSRNEVYLADHSHLTARVVLDGRGPENLSYGAAGFQKFVGLELRTRGFADLIDPASALLMDARVAQLDGYRFMYVVPLPNGRLLVEDTCFSNHDHLDVKATKERILRYCQANQIRKPRVTREESGVLPLPWRVSRSQTRLTTAGGALRIGYGGGFFNPATGHSVTTAMAVADAVATALAATRDHPDRVAAAVTASIAKQRRQLLGQQRFFRFLNRMLFTAVPPDQRWRVFSHFYRLPPTTIERFYAMDLHWADMARILLRRPPAGFSLRSALAAMEAT